MKMLNRKSKMVSFRLSPEEYRVFRDACESNGVRSISELARTAMQHLVAAGAKNPGAAHVDDQIRDLRDRVTLLSDEIERLTRRIDYASAATN